jgi:indole-3-glycerol phosphate synthase
MNFLETILAAKREEVRDRKRTVLRARLEDMAGYASPRRSLARALSGRNMAVLAEIKKASPSRNVIREQFDARAIAQQYQRGGASALSVLTDEKFFQGSLEILAAVRRTVDLPLLRKDFIIDSYQIHEARAYGADAVLLIAAALNTHQLHELAEEARLAGLECMVEVHTEEEVESLEVSRFDLVGINNRDLMTFEAEILTSVRLRKRIPQGSVVVSESGIRTAEDLHLLMQHHIHAVLIGEHFMRAADPGAALRALLSGVDGGSP